MLIGKWNLTTKVTALQQRGVILRGFL